MTGRVSSIVSFRITPDITRETGSGGTLDGSMSVRLKYGYAQFTLDRFTGAWRNTWVRVGMQQTPFIDAEEAVYRYRFQGTVFAERDGGLSSADTGVSFHTNLPNNYGDVHAGVYNGEGYTRAEANDQKAVMIRGTVRPMPDRWRAGARVSGSPATPPRSRDGRGRPEAGHRQRVARAAPVQRGVRLRDGDRTRRHPTATRVKSDGYSFFVTPFFRRRAMASRRSLRYDSFRAEHGDRPTRGRTAPSPASGVLVPAPGRERHGGGPAQLRAVAIQELRDATAHAGAGHPARPHQFLNRRVRRNIFLKRTSL